MLEFCSDCHNLLFIESGDNGLHHHCRACDKITEITSNIIVYDTETDIKQIKINEIVNNKFLKYDNTLPRLHDIPCKNPKCSKKKEDINKIIYYEIDTKNLTYIYICEYCDKHWLNV